MMRSLFSAVSGLKTHQTRMDVIGNNISNVNTEAFKASQVRFSEIMYQTSSSASGGDATSGIGGVNAKQIGLGVATASTTCDISTAGAAETTGNPFDLRLSDSQTTNFFIVSNGSETMFTRAGSFYVDGNGYLCMSSTGYIVQGWQVDAETGEIRKTDVSSLQVMSAKNQTAAPEATTMAKVSGILDKTDTNIRADGGYMLSLSFYDNLGYTYNAKFSVTQDQDADGEYIDGQYTIALTDIIGPDDKDGDGNLDSILSADEATLATQLQNLFNGTTGGKSLVYDTNDGTLISIGGQTDGVNNVTAMLNMSVITTNTTSEDGTTSNFDNIEIDFSDSLNQYNSGTSTLKVLKGVDGQGEGKKVGKLTGLQVDEQGCIYGNYDNGNTVLLCQIAVAQFANASGLEKVGDNCYQTTLNSGEFDGIGVEINADGSKINSGQLEMSNVDLSGQFTDMIITQRGFQANSRVITVSDTLLEELINLKR